MAANESWVVDAELGGVWVPITRWVDGPIVITQGDTAETTDEGSMTLFLQNADQRWTPGNQLSPYYPYIRSGTRIRISEVIGSNVFVLFTGYIEWPEIEAWTASTSDAPRDQRIAINAVDQMTRFVNGPLMPSTLGAYILTEFGRGLVDYWPLDEAAWPAVGSITGSETTLTVSGSTSVVAAEALTFGSAAPMPGDDVHAPTWTCQFDAGGTYLGGLYLAVSLDDPIVVPAGSVITVSLWARVLQISTDLPTSTLILINDSTTDDLLSIGALAPSSGGVWTASALGATWGGSADRPITWDAPAFVSLQYAAGGTSISMVVNGDEYTGVVATPPAALSFDQISIGVDHQGSIHHVQIHIAAAGDAPTVAQRVAQWQMGLAGLEYQLTGDRIRTILRYAGVPATSMVRVDDGVAVMQQASLAGKSAAAALAEASDTERGSVYAAGDGQIVFADRRRLFDI